jgi:hypothetical protein
MDHAAYVRVLLSVWVGLGLGEIVKAFNRIVRFKGEVRWDWLPLAWAGLAFLMVVQIWWAYFTLLQAAVWANLFAFLFPLLAFVLIYLICASALPDVSGRAVTEPVDLEQFHFGQKAYFFALWGILFVVAIIVASMARGRADFIGEDGFRVAGVIGALILARSGRRTVHTTVTILTLVGLGTYITLYTLRLI